MRQDEQAEQFERLMNERRAVVDLIAQRELTAHMLEQLYEIYSPEGVGLWLKGRKQSLDGRSPIDAIRDGDVAKVALQVDQMVTGAFS